MKKLILLFSAFLFLLFPSFTSHAELMPPSLLQSGAPSVIPSGQLTGLEGFGHEMPTYYFESQGFDLMGETWEDAVNNFNGLEIDPDYTWSHKPLTDFKWPETSTDNLYDSNGNVVPFSEAGYLQGQNAYSGVFALYSLETGEILNIGTSFETSISTVNASVTSDFWGTTGEILSFFGPSSPKAPLAIYNPYDTTTELVDYYYNMPHSAYWYDSVHDIGCFVANVNETDTVFVQLDSGYNFVVYFNDNASVNIWNNWQGGGGWQNLKPQQGSFGVGGNTYGWRFPPIGFLFNITSSKPEGTNTAGKRDDNVTYYTPQEPYDLPEVVNRDKMLRNPVNKHTVLNPDYNENNTYNYYNFNFTTTTEAPDVAPTTNYYQYIYNYFTNPSEGESIGDLTEGDITGNLPILSNLQYRFPFSIPFDIYKLYKGLAVERETPYINTDFVFPRINYTWHIEYNLSEFDGIAELFRTLFLIGFIIGLALYSYDHFFGS